jgi:hypothetical protein
MECQLRLVEKPLNDTKKLITQKLEHQTELVKKDSAKSIELIREAIDDEFVDLNIACYIKGFISHTPQDLFFSQTNPSLT